MKKLLFVAIATAAIGMSIAPTLSSAQVTIGVGVGADHGPDWRYRHRHFAMDDNHDNGWHEGWRHHHDRGCVIIRKWRDGQRIVIKKCG